jgi:hypothetical protein
LHAAPTVTQRNRHCTLGFILANNVLDQFLYDFTGSHGGHGIWSSINVFSKESFDRLRMSGLFIHAHGEPVEPFKY